MYESKKENKDHESIQSNTTPDPGHHIGKRQNKSKYYTQESQDVSPFPTGEDKAARNRQDSKIITKHKQLKKHRLGTVSKIITDWLKHV